MEKLFKDEGYVNQEIVRIRKQMIDPENTFSDWEVMFKSLGFMLVHVSENQIGMVQATLNEVHTRHSFWMQKHGIGSATFTPLV